ncbi:hypothetical protein XELAEV_18011672mg [Xenopus laevis]|uniref:Uncharacterized protein n=1 Tax=Xenopus laevis TaxID=8355 RepID=A0A974HXI6_XENLA|nr:hypothetical protein XELAEV_18011672mg [Xenopus laevis]
MNPIPSPTFTKCIIAVVLTIQRALPKGRKSTINFRRNSGQRYVQTEMTVIAVIIGILESTDCSGSSITSGWYVLCPKASFVYTHTDTSCWYICICVG